ncbi:MAG TPA: EAL domain-containing protein [Acidimicrobiales bacterium]|nr:EAL domain-containing protein [Acidimicrobiales bacterium]
MSRHGADRHADFHDDLYPDRDPGADADPGAGFELVYQPIADLQGGRIAGYEALARFAGAAGPPPDRVFAAARAAGRAAELDVAVVRSALAARKHLPANCFLSINVEPASLGEPAVQGALLSGGRLEGVVIELTEHLPIDSYSELGDQLQPLRGAGALVALDDTGAGYAGLQHLLSVRPSIVKLDRSLVSGIDQDEAKVGVVELLGVLANRIDAWLLAEGVERAEEAVMLRTLGVPLAQGWLFGRPVGAFSTLSPAGRRLLETAPRASGPSETLHDLLRPVTAFSERRLDDAARALGTDEDLDWIVVLGDDLRAIGMIDRDAALVGVVRHVLAVNVSTPPVELAQRMLTRPAGERLLPVLCHDDLGQFVGTVMPETLLAELARGASLAGGASTGGAALLSVNRNRRGTPRG